MYTEQQALTLAKQFATQKRGIFMKSHGDPAGVSGDLGMPGVTEDDVFRIILAAGACSATPRQFYWGQVSDNAPVDDLFGFDGNLGDGTSVRTLLSVAAEYMVVFRTAPRN
jgi:hypothetical protein